jgi:hypothetical protein
MSCWRVLKPDERRFWVSTDVLFRTKRTVHFCPCTNQVHSIRASLAYSSLGARLVLKRQGEQEGWGGGQGLGH